MYEVKYKKVKNITLKINTKGEIIVVAPMGLNPGIIDKFVKSKARWIDEKIAVIKKKQALSDNFINQNTRLFLGTPYTVKIDKTLTKSYQFDHKQKLLWLSKEKQALKKSYQDLAQLVFRDVLISLLPLIAPYYAKVPKLTLRQMSKRYGTCYPLENRIIINTKLIQAPYHLIELVILHELIHFIYPHHQKQFYELFDELLPDRKKREKELHEFSFILDVKI